MTSRGNWSPIPYSEPVVKPAAKSEPVFVWNCCVGKVYRKLVKEKTRCNSNLLQDPFCCSCCRKSPG
jgi:hypothetical protein